MAIAYTATGQTAGVATETSGGNCNPTCPSTVNAGDILIAHVYFEGTTTSPDTPSGWTLLDGPRVVETTIGRHWIFGKVADGSEDSTAVSFGTQAVTTMRGARIYRFTGRVSGAIADLVNGFSATSHATDPQMPSVTTTAAGALAVACVVQNDNNALAAATGESGGDWTEATAEFVAALTPGMVLQLQTCTPTGNPGTVSGGAVAATNDPSGVIGFQIRDSAPVLLTPSGVVHTRAFGTAQLNFTLFESSVTHTRAFGTAVLPNRGRVAWGAFVVPPAADVISPTGVVHTRAIGTASLARGAVTITEPSVAHSRDIPLPKVNLTIHEAAVLHTRAIGTAVVQRGAVVVVTASVVHTRAFGTALIVSVITTTSVQHTRAFGTAVIATGATQNLLPQPVVHTRAIGGVSVLRGTVTITPGSVVHTRAIGTAQINPRRGLVAWSQFVTPPVSLAILPSGVVHTRAFGTAIVQSSKLTPSSTVHARAFGTASVVGLQVVFPTSTVHTRAFGTQFVAVEPHIAAAGFVFLWGDVDFGKIEPQGVVHPRAIGTAKLTMFIVATSTVHARAFGVPTAGRFIAGISFEHTRAFGTARLNFTMKPSSVIHNRIVETPQVGAAVTTLLPASLVHVRALGTATLTVSEFAQTIFAISVVRSRNITGPLVTRAGDPAAKRQSTFSAEWGIDTFHPGDVDVEVTS